MIYFIFIALPKVMSLQFGALILSHQCHGNGTDLYLWRILSLVSHSVSDSHSDSHTVHASDGIKDIRIGNQRKGELGLMWQSKSLQSRCQCLINDSLTSHWTDREKV